MKILFCTKRDIFGAVILNSILPQLKNHQVKVLLSDKTRSEENSVQELVEEKFLERDLPVNLIFPLIDAQPFCGDLLTFSGCARRFNISISTIHQINHADSEKMIQDWAPDIIVSARFSLIFKSNIEKIPPLGIFNIHPGQLPGYAGLCAPLRGLLFEETELGCTLHKVDEGIDTGPIYAVAYLKAEPEKSVFGHIEQLYQLGLENLLRLLAETSSGLKPELKVQDPAAFRYFRLPDAQTFQKLRMKNIELVNYEIYSKLISKFIPVQLQSRFHNKLTGKIIHQATKEASAYDINSVLRKKHAELVDIF